MDELILLVQQEIVEVAEEMAGNAERDFWTSWQKGDPFDLLSDKKCLKLFRLSKPLALDLIQDLDNFLVPPTRESALPKKIKVLIALNFYAEGSYQNNIGTNKYFGASQSSVSRCVAEVTSALNNNEIFNQWVYFPRNFQELGLNRRKFYEAYGIPGIVGVIDCTHVAIHSPSGDDYPEHIYVNRKNYHSINTQLICDIDMKIINVNARYPGSTHDAYIWNNSNINQHIQQLNRGDNNYFLIGDSGYPLRKWLQTQVRDPPPESPEEEYNRHFRKARCTIERCNGLLKTRFRCLLKDRVLHYSPTVASKIINACVVLHNMCITNNIPVPEPEPGDEELDLEMDFGEQVDEDDELVNRNADLQEGRRLQRQIIRNYFR